MKADELVSNRNTNGAEWAKAFMGQIKNMPRQEIDESFMITWFANAIQTTMDACWPGACVGCEYVEENEKEELICSRGSFDPVDPFFFCADFKCKWTNRSNNEEATVVQEL